MINDVITYLNAKIDTLGYFNSVICLAERIEREGRIYPAQYISNGDYKEISLDPSGSICYWRKNGDVTIAEEELTSGIGIQYKTSFPLKFVGFIKKEAGKDTQYFADNLISGLIGNLTVSNSALKTALNAKSVRITATKYSTDGREVANSEYDNINYEPYYTHAYFSIEFNLIFITSSQCYTDICNDLPINFGYVTILDGSGNIIGQVKCGGEYVCTGGSSGGSYET